MERCSWTIGHRTLLVDHWARNLGHGPPEALERPGPVQPNRLRARVGQTSPVQYSPTTPEDGWG
eukprot:10161870-Lingulodinium_polyedra.AAC.1